MSNRTEYLAVVRLTAREREALHRITDRNAAPDYVGSGIYKDDLGETLNVAERVFNDAENCRANLHLKTMDGESTAENIAAFERVRSQLVKDGMDPALSEPALFMWLTLLGHESCEPLLKFLEANQEAGGWAQYAFMQGFVAGSVYGKKE